MGYMRNGDFNPSRFASQSDAVSLISNAKTQQNHENTVGLIAMHPNSKADVLVNCTQDIGRVLSSLSKMKIGDNSLIKPPSLSISHSEQKTFDHSDDAINILVALQTAQLALKHRKNKKQDQRIILFVGSPITKTQSEKLLIKAAKRLKKNNMGVDIVNFGENEENTDLLQRFMNAVKANDNSNLVTIEPGKLLSDVLISTPIFAQGGQQINEYGGLGGANDADLNAAIRASQQDQGGGGGALNQFGGVDPNTDPELAMALRMSMEEERQRQEREAKAAAESKEKEKEKGGEPEDVPMANNEENDKEKEKEKESENKGVSDMAEELGIDDEDEELLKALQMSMEEENGDVQMDDNDNQNEDNFVDELLDGLPGIDQNDLEEIGNMEDLLNAVDDEEDKDKKDKKR